MIGAPSDHPRVNQNYLSRAFDEEVALNDSSSAIYSETNRRGTASASHKRIRMKRSPAAAYGSALESGRAPPKSSP
jgi:hypothetical protein